MPPFVAMKNAGSDNAIAVAHTAVKPDMSCLPAFNVAGGRPTERFGIRGSFTPGVRILSGGPPREVQLEADAVDHGKVLFVSSTLKPDLSGEARTNVAGGRPTERLGTRGRFTQGAKTCIGGEPRDVPLEAEILDHGEVLFVSSTLKPDLTGEAQTNVAGGRPTERLGSRGRFTPGARRWLGGEPRDVPLPRALDPGTVIFQSNSLPSPPPHSTAVETNVAGGRDDERHGRLGSFEHGVVVTAGGPLQMPSNSVRQTELWHEGGQKENKYRRCGPGHFVAGVSILAGGMPLY